MKTFSSIYKMPSFDLTHQTFLFIFFFSIRLSISQSISSNMPLPPMEWIKLNPMGSTSPPPLSHGCLCGPTLLDSTSNLPGFNQAFLFGGLSSARTSSNGIYVLDYSSADQPPTWSQPPPTTSTIFTSSPQARSHFLCGWDSASNFRNQLNIWGGRSQDGQPLADFWSYDPTNHFWVQPKEVLPPTHPSIYGAIGGIDPSYSPEPPGTSNAMIFIGGANSSQSNENLSPAALSIDGQLGSNTDTINVNYTNLLSGLTGNASSNNLLTGRWGMTGTVLPGSKIVIFSGCNGDPSQEFQSPPNPACSLMNGGILQFESGFSPSRLAGRSSIPHSSWTSFNYCPAPRIGGAMVPNRNRFDSSYANQVIMIGGRIDSQNWNDQGGSKLGEVDVLDISSGVWARVLPMIRDNATFTQKEGLLALALPTSINSKSSTSSSPSTTPTDILVYGGIDVATGEASNELWILRLHAAKLTGNGTADGVTMSYMPSCVTPTPHNKHNISKSPFAPGSPDGRTDQLSLLVAPSGHWIFSAIALAMMTGSLTILRCEEPQRLSIKNRWRTSRLWLLLSAWMALIVSCLILGLAILIPLLETRSQDDSSSRLIRRGLLDGDPDFLKLDVQDTLSRSTHGRLGLVIGVLLLFVVPGLYLLNWLDALLEERRKKRQLTATGPRRLKAKESQRSALRRRLERIFFLDRPFKNSTKDLKQHPFNPESISQHQLESLGEKQSSDLMVAELQLSAPSSAEPSPQLPPIAPLSHERLGSTSTTCTNTQLLSSKFNPFVTTTNANTPTRVSEPAGPSNPSTPSLTRPPSHSKIKTIPATERSFIRPIRSPLSKVFNKFSTSLFPAGSSESSSNSHHHHGTADQQESKSSPAASSSFEVLNRRPPRQRGVNPPASRSRVSLDIISDDGSRTSLHEDHLHGRHSNKTKLSNYHEPPLGERKESGENGGSQAPRDYSVVVEQDPLYGEEEEEQEEDDDDDDDSFYKQIKPRRKIRRFADVVFHSALLATNVYFITACFVSHRSLKWLGIVYSFFCLFAYSAMVWFAWIGKPSSESTLVIFVSIIKDGSMSLMNNQNLTGVGQFSSFGQQQQELAQQVQAQQMMGSGGGRRSTMGSRGAAFSMHGDSQPAMSQSASQTDGHSGFFRSLGGSEAAPPGSEILENDLFPARFVDLATSERDFLDFDSLDHSQPLRPPRKDDPGENYLLDREVQIVTTAPRRKLAVVNH